MTTNGSDDQKITPEGLPNYIVPPPTILEPSTTSPQVTDVVELAQNEDKDTELDVEEELEAWPGHDKGQTIEPECLEDQVEDQDF